MRPTVILFLKEPRPGRVKTRLGQGVGPVAAAGWYRRQALATIRRLGRDPRWRLVLAVAPDREGMASRVWPRGVARLPQGSGNLGRRMVRALNAVGSGPALVIGSDVPRIDRARIAAALTALRGADAAIGPSSDGGFWLIGRSAGQRWPRALLEGCAWSTDRARADTLARLAPRRVALTETLDDVDTAADLVAAGLPLP
ncbi:MAG: TIGR04282 family arsenosugar biosynthesis glycosyltransferase [Pseudomonadota bacterium]